LLNTVVLIGRLTRDPEPPKYLQSGKALTTIRLAVDRGTTNPQGERETDYIDVVCWERLAETVSNHLAKGRLVAVAGRLQVRQYEKDGQKREKAEVVANTVRFLDRAGDAGAPAGGGGGGGGFADSDDVPFDL
jgi:single-strand DNA-binding protein